MLLSLVLTTLTVPNPNCLPRGKCITVGPGTKYPEQNTICLADTRTDASWHCAALSGTWGGGDHSFGPGNTMDLTMMGGSPRQPGPPLSLNETFTVHAWSSPTYGKCQPSGPAQWKVTREVTYLNGTADGSCQTRILESGRVLGTFVQNCTTLSEILLDTDETTGEAKAVGCRCCSKCVGAPCLDP